MEKEIYIGKGLQQKSIGEVKGELTEIAGEVYYVIHNYDQMKPFFITVVSDSDHWMYLSSKGSLTAGRANPGLALFPYYTDDKIHDSDGVTGSKTIMLVSFKDKTRLWEPFSKNFKGIYRIERNLYKKALGNNIIFEEINHDLQLTFKYSWASSERYGWVRESTLCYEGKDICKVEFIDGIQNILPWGINRNMQNTSSTLVDAYKKSELVKGSSLAFYSLSSIPVDRAEPSEALKANAVWSAGTENTKYLLSTNQLNGFSEGNNIETETEKQGIKGAYFIQSACRLKKGEAKNWFIVAEVALDASKVVKLSDELTNEKALLKNILSSIEQGCWALENLVAKADGIQLTGDRINGKRHFSNTLFNIMRGGIPQNGYTIDKTDFRKHLNHFNQKLEFDLKGWIDTLPETINYNCLVEEAEKLGNNDLIRLSLEYLPLMFSRRHGDPSRPWNIFDIKLKNGDGTPSLYYQGNWRDIFQNWEALAMSYPIFVKGMIARFLNASTADGYNPYRITRDGIDWELLDPSDPWSNIGYWGDHQIIYLEKLLELSERFFPGNLEKWMNQSIFAYANVPYEHKPYNRLVENPRDTIEYNESKQIEIDQHVVQKGADGKLIMVKGTVLNVNFTEKALVPLLSKLSNFVPGAGIWMNTQRPEWNDANNALVGYGASMVTLYYMRRYVSFLLALYHKAKSDGWLIQSEVYRFYTELKTILIDNIDVLKGKLTGKMRKHLLDCLGKSGSDFRNQVYKGFSGETNRLEKKELTDFLENVLHYIDHSIEMSKRPDGLYHAYNLISIKGDEIDVRHLDEMLEGQVAVLSSGVLTANEALSLLNTLRNSALYRNDQRSYILYPDKKLPGFLEKNNINSDQVKRSQLLSKLISDGNKEIIRKDIHGNLHFDGLMNNAETLKAALNKLPTGYQHLVEEEMGLIQDIYEEVFDHQSFTGRSGSFYKYEGLGCIYWHMVSKLLLAVGENIRIAQKAGEAKEIVADLEMHYAEIREGIGSHKSPADYGAFPTDPYSHTPSTAGVQQPGMTGQVKEDLLSRWMELGLEVVNGKIHFTPAVTGKNEFSNNHTVISIKQFKTFFNIEFPVGMKYLAYSFCGVPVVCIEGTCGKLEVLTTDGSLLRFDEFKLDRDVSQRIFHRDNYVKMIRITFKRN